MGIPFFFSSFFFVCGLFVQWNECSLLFSSKENTIYGVDALLFCSIMQMKFLLSLYINRFFSYFTNILWDKKKTYIPMRIWPYASSSLHVTDLETMYLSRLSEYGTEENVDWIYAIWFWPVLHLTLLVVLVFLFVFSVALSPPPPPSSWAVFVPFCVEVGSLFAWLFYSVQATKQSLLCYTRKNKW